MSINKAEVVLMIHKIFRMMVSREGKDGSNAISFGLLMFRISIGCFMLFGHGLAKLMGYSQMSATFPDPLGIGNPAISMAMSIFAEFLMSIALAFGFLTRFALIPLIINMSVALIFIHKADPFKVKELAFMYLIAYVVMMITGPGRYSLDAMFVRLTRKP
jgi:putative oxidoreductase